MTSKTCWTLNRICFALLFVIGMVVFIGCAEETTTYNGTYSNGATDSAVTTDSASTVKKDQVRDSDSGSRQFDAALDRAKAENKPIYLLFSATWCGPCKTYKNTVLNDAQVKRSLDNDVIFVSADIDRDKALARKYNVSGVPTGFFIRVQNGQTQTANSHVGGLDKQEFMKFINK